VTCSCLLKLGCAVVTFGASPQVKDLPYTLIANGHGPLLRCGRLGARGALLI
jgi:hypothetical protein